MPADRSYRAPFAWREVFPGSIPRCAGVYAVYEAGVLVYIGSSTNLWARARSYFSRWITTPRDYGESWPGTHRTPWGTWHNGDLIRVKVKPSRRYGDWLMREWRLIGRLQPVRNRAGRT